MATIRKLRGCWQAQVRRRGAKPRAKSFDTKAEAERWARDIEAQVDRFGAAPDTKILETTTLGDLDVPLRHELAHRTLIGLSASDLASYRDERLTTAAPSTALRPIQSFQASSFMP